MMKYQCKYKCSYIQCTLYFIICDILIFGVANTDWPKVSDKERGLGCIELRMETLQWLACKKTSRKGVKGLG